MRDCDPTLTFPVCELFASIQGEGTWSGRPMLFIRFSGCPLACSWCDEPLHRQPQRAQSMTVAALLAQLRQTAPNLNAIVLTGGEPLAVNGLQPLINRLKQEGFWLAMESSGVGGALPEAIDWLTLSPKTALPESVYQAANEIKYVVDANPDAALLAEIDRRSREHAAVWLQPMARGKRVDADAVARCFDLVMNSGGRLRLSLQLHKYIGVL
ncbi:MAG: 7-carboxy-7-deazaguanine synthase QueE [Magnetococcales bacterium]|nr:7-carboxy-7-deazaguanine synthase QueE [Magnetococcales bacterium]